MTATDDVLTLVRAIANVTAAALVDDAFDEFDLAARRSDAGLEVDGVVVWQRVADDVVIARVGNHVEADRASVPVEVPVPR